MAQSVQPVLGSLVNDGLASVAQNRLAVVVQHRCRGDDAGGDLDEPEAAVDQIGVRFHLADAVWEDEVKIALWAG